MSAGQQPSPRAINLSVDEAPRLALVGPPNSGKSSLFNHLTGLRQRTANFPGVTVERKLGQCLIGERTWQIFDLPGLYSLNPHSQDESICVDVLLQRIQGVRPPDRLLVVIDAARLTQGLYLLRQLLRLPYPIIVALTMADVTTTKGRQVDADALSQLLGIPVVPVSGLTGAGLPALKQALAALEPQDMDARPALWPGLDQAIAEIREAIDGALPGAQLERALINPAGALADELRNALGDRYEQLTQPLNEVVFSGQHPRAAEARSGHAWAREIAAQCTRDTTPVQRFSQVIGNWLTRPWVAGITFLAVMLIVFQAVFAWATPLMDLIDGAVSSLGAAVTAVAGDGMLGSFLADGVIAGVGSVIIFLPQIMFLFFFLIILEDSGFLARSAFLLDRLMRPFGLSGQSVIPLVSSFACAVPAVMATRVIPSKRQRIATMLAAPFMTCSARLPVYALLIAAFVPAESIGGFNLQGLVLFGLYLLGILGGVFTAMLVNRFVRSGTTSGFAMSLPELRRPNLKTVLYQLLDRGRIFLRRAGTVIFAVAVVIWALSYFPRTQPPPDLPAEAQQAYQLEHSFLGRAGHVVEPVFKPLGWDWRVSAAVLAGFPAREVVVAILGTIYAVGDDASEERLSDQLRAAKWPDGRQVFTLPMVLGLLIFYAWCLQCVATVAVIKRETNSWRWPLFAWSYMTVLGYLGALVIYQTF